MHSKLLDFDQFLKHEWYKMVNYNKIYGIINIKYNLLLEEIQYVLKL